jgi:hypothetical protein
MSVDIQVWRDVLCEAITTHVDEISCEECYSQLDRFTELTLQGSAAAQLMPRVQDHLDHCRECRQEYEALMAAVRGIAQPPPRSTSALA